mmetsp:Transcript_119771/g.383496  ORF Transcript_119771/g.383496 Transcript_119771/m.383496 type:complete len:203 (-) Transcript_119771:1409-2017(-)
MKQEGDGLRHASGNQAKVRHDVSRETIWPKAETHARWSSRCGSARCTITQASGASGQTRGCTARWSSRCGRARPIEDLPRRGRISRSGSPRARRAVQAHLRCSKPSANLNVVRARLRSHVQRPRRRWASQQPTHARASARHDAVRKAKRGTAFAPLATRLPSARSNSASRPKCRSRATPRAFAQPAGHPKALPHPCCWDRCA